MKPNAPKHRNILRKIDGAWFNEARTKKPQPNTLLLSKEAYDQACRDCARELTMKKPPKTLPFTQYGTCKVRLAEDVPKCGFRFTHIPVDEED